MACFKGLCKSGNHLRKRIREKDAHIEELRKEICELKEKNQFAKKTVHVTERSVDDVEFHEEEPEYENLPILKADLSVKNCEREIKQLNELCKKQEKELRKFKIENQSLEDFVLNQCKNESITNMIQNSQQEHDESFSMVIEQFKQTVAQIITENDNLKKENNELKEKLKLGTRKMTVEESVELNQWRQREIILSQEIEDLKAKLSKFKNQSDESQKGNQIHEKSSVPVTQQLKTVELLTTENDHLKMDKVQLEEKLQQVMKKIEINENVGVNQRGQREMIMSQEIIDLKKELSNYRRQSELLKKSTEELENSLEIEEFSKNELLCQRDDTIINLQNEIEYCKKQNDDLNSICVENERHVNNLEQKLETLNNKLTEELNKSKKLDMSLNQQISMNKFLRSSYEKKKHEDENFSKFNEYAKKNLLQGTSDISGETNFGATTTNIYANQATIVKHAEIEDLRKQLEHKDQNVDILHQDLDSYKTTTIQLREEVERLKELLERETTNEERQKHVESTNEETAAELNKAKNKLAGLEEKLKESEKNVAILEQELFRIQTENEFLQTQIEALRKNVIVVDVASPKQIAEKANEEQDPQESYVEQCLKKITNVQKDAQTLEERVNAFVGNSKNKEFLDLEELLIRLLVKLDNVESEGHAEIRKERKIVLQYVQRVMDVLKARASSS